MERISGIYCIENLANHKKYVGKSVNILRRWESEKNGLRGSYFHNVHLQRAWEKYGESQFKFYILEVCQENELEQKKMHWIATLDSFNSGYNQTLGGEGTVGLAFSEERRRRIGEAHFGEKNSNTRPVYCFELDREFWGAKEAEQIYQKLYRVRANGISMCCNGLRSYCGRLPNGVRLHWCYANEKDTYSIPLVGKEKPVYCPELDEVFENKLVAQNDIRISKINSGDITRCYNGNKHHKTCGRLADGTRLTWRYATDEEIHLLKNHIAKRNKSR